MDRKEFLKTLGLTTFVLPLLSASCRESDPTDSNGDCKVTEDVTAGPFPTKDPASLSITDIRSDRQGVPFLVKITVKDQNNNCQPLANAIVDIWHCDKDGAYSEYGGTGMQSTNYTSVHFLRGRQTSNADGLVTFQSIYPGWYSGRAPHIHVHIYNAAGNSLLITQIAFPETTNTTVYTTSSLYSFRGVHNTSNSEDNVFNGSTDTLLAQVTGSVADGYTMEHSIVVEA